MTTTPLRAGIRVVRHRPAPEVRLGPDGPPLIDPRGPAEHQVQQDWTARVRVFDLSDEKQMQDYEAVWQKVCDAKAIVSEERIEWSAQKDNFKAYLRWSDLSYRAPNA